MRYQLFQYALPAPPELADLNAFLASRRIAAVQHHVVPTSGGSQLLFVVQVLDGELHSHTKRSGSQNVDYRELLTPEQFQVYARLRAERKAIAEAEGVPIYAIFTNAQLAEMVRMPVEKLEDLRTIEGVGAARVERYGSRFLAILKPNP